MAAKPTLVSSPIVCILAVPLSKNLILSRRYQGLALPMTIAFVTCICCQTTKYLHQAASCSRHDGRQTVHPSCCLLHQTCWLCCAGNRRTRAVCCNRLVGCDVQAIDIHELGPQHTAQASAAGNRLVGCFLQAIDVHELAQQHTAQASAAGNRLGVYVVQAIDIHELAQQHTAQASAAGNRAGAAEEQAQQFEAQGKFADAAAAALQADRSALCILHCVCPAHLRRT